MTYCRDKLLDHLQDPLQSYTMSCRCLGVRVVAEVAAGGGGDGGGVFDPIVDKQI